MENAFEEVNRARCFNHTLQLSAKTLLKPFNAGLSSEHPAVEEEEMRGLGDEVPELSNYDAGNNGNDSDGGDGEADLGDDDEPEISENEDDGIDELEDLDEDEREKILADTAVVRQTVSKVISIL
jgi:hypothetical protein